MVVCTFDETTSIFRSAISDTSASQRPVETRIHLKLAHPKLESFRHICRRYSCSQLNAICTVLGHGNCPNYPRAVISSLVRTTGRMLSNMCTRELRLVAERNAILPPVTFVVIYSFRTRIPTELLQTTTSLIQLIYPIKC